MRKFLLLTSAALVALLAHAVAVQAVFERLQLAQMSGFDGDYGFINSIFYYKNKVFIAGDNGDDATIPIRTVTIASPCVKDSCMSGYDDISNPVAYPATFDSQAGNSRLAFYKVGHYGVVSDTASAQLARIDLDNPTATIAGTSIWTGPASTYVDVAAVWGTKLVFAPYTLANDVSSLYTLDTATADFGSSESSFTITDTTGFGSAAVYKDFGYFATSSSTLIKIDLVNQAEVDTVTLPAGEIGGLNQVYGSFIANDRLFLYGTSQQYVVASYDLLINGATGGGLIDADPVLTTWGATGSQDIRSKPVIVNGYVFLTSFSAGQVIKFDPKTKAQVAAIDPTGTEGNMYYSLARNDDGTRLFCIIRNSGGAYISAFDSGETEATNNAASGLRTFASGLVAAAAAIVLALCF